MTEQQQDQPDRAREPLREQQGDGREGPPGGLRPQHPLRDGGRAGEGEAGEAPGAGVGQEGLDQGAGHSEWRPARVLVPPVEGRAGQADPGRELIKNINTGVFIIRTMLLIICFYFHIESTASNSLLSGAVSSAVAVVGKGRELCNIETSLETSDGGEREEPQSSKRPDSEGGPAKS